MFSLPVGKAKATVSVKVTLWSPFSSSDFLSEATMFEVYCSGGKHTIILQFSHWA